jgi:hypothetical protein
LSQLRFEILLCFFNLRGWCVGLDAGQDPDFLRPFEEKGERVTLEESEGKSVNPALIRTLAFDQQKP